MLATHNAYDECTKIVMAYMLVLLKTTKLVTL